MQIEKTSLPDCYLLTPRVFEDERGYFMETFNKKDFEDALGVSGDFVQDNQSYSTYGVIRGLHMQKPPYEQAKLVRAVQGRIWDIAVDFRVGSDTFGQWFGAELSEFNRKQLYIPRGFLHGFSVLSEQAIVAYKTDAFYAPNQEFGVYYADPYLNITWQIPESQALVSAKDLELPYFEKIG